MCVELEGDKIISDIKLYNSGEIKMAEGGFLIKFDGKEIKRCYAVSFDYDTREYIVNNKEKNTLPLVKTITIEVESK